MALRGLTGDFQQILWFWQITYSLRRIYASPTNRKCVRSMSPPCHQKRYNFTNFSLASKSVLCGWEPQLSCTNSSASGFAFRPVKADTPASCESSNIYFLGDVSHQFTYSHSCYFWFSMCLHLLLVVSNLDRIPQSLHMHSLTCFRFW
jgi:hypothetical protein